MKASITILGLTLGLALVSSNAVAGDNEIEGYVESVDPGSQSVMVEGIVFYTDRRTDYDDGLRSFYDLRPGQKVEVEFIYRDGFHIATEIELED